MPAKQWDQFTSFVNAYYAVQEHLEEVRSGGGEAGSGLSDFCHDANPFLWDAPGSADPAIYRDFCTAFLSRFSSTQSTAAEALAFCRDWLKEFGGERYQGELLDAFDSVVDSPQTWENAYAPINEQLELRARINEMSPQDDPADHAPQAAEEHPSKAEAAAATEAIQGKDAAGKAGGNGSPAQESTPQTGRAPQAAVEDPRAQGSAKAQGTGKAATVEPDSRHAAASRPKPKGIASTNVLVHDWSGSKDGAVATTSAPASGSAPIPTPQQSTIQEETTMELVAPGAPQEVHKATLSDTDAIASLLAMDDPLLARSLEEFIMRGMQCGTVVELVVRENDEVVACGGLTFVELMPTPENPSGVYGVVSGLAAKHGHTQNLQLLLKAMEKKSLARGVGELMLLDGSAVSVQACEQYGYRLEGSRILMRL